MMPESELLTTALLEEHIAAGAHLVPFAGWKMPLRYTSHLAEHEAVRSAAGIFDLSHMAQIYVSGQHASDGLGACLISPVNAMAVGRAKYSMITDETGGILDDLIVYRLAEDRYLVVSNASNRETVVNNIVQRCAAVDPDIIVADRTKERAIVAVQGPNSADVLNDAGFAESTGIRYYSVTSAQFENADILVARTGYTGEDGFEIYLDSSDAPRLWNYLIQTGANHGLALCGLACRDTLRLEAGMPLYGNELNVQLSPADVGMARMVKLDHDFVGREALADREGRFGLIGLRGEGRRAARSGSTVKRGGEDIGEITSGVLSPTLGYPIALARVITPTPELGEELTVEVRGKAQMMTVVNLPFYSRKK